MPINVVDGDTYEAPLTIEPDCDWPIIMNCDPSTAFDAETVTLAKAFAADVMNAATARQFGVCTSTFMPLPPEPCAVGHQDAWSLVDPKINAMIGAERFREFYDGSSGCGDCGWYGCVCGVNTKIRLWHARVVDVLRVLIDGVILDSSAYYLEGNVLVRDDGGSWPTTQSGRRGATGTWEITYRHGKPLPIAGMTATGVLACEIAMALTGDEDCSLPSRTKSYTSYAGLTLNVLDPMEFLVDGLTGLEVPDYWITKVNPHRLVRRARAYSFHKKRRGARRVTNPIGLPANFPPVYTGDADQTIKVKLIGGDPLSGAISVEAHVWVDPGDVTVLAASVFDVAENIVEVELGDVTGWLATLVQDPGEVVVYNLQVQVTFAGGDETWPPDLLPVIGQAA